MSRSVAYSVLIKDGQKRSYEDVWLDVHRELMWGPEAFETWLTAGEETDWEPEELCGVAIVDFDTKELRWGEREVFDIPRVHAAHERLLQEAWPEFTILFLSEGEMYAAVRRQFDRDTEDDELANDRPETVREAAGLYDDDDEDTDDEDEDEDDDVYRFGEDTPRAWVTLIDSQGKTRHRHLTHVSADLLSASKAAIQQLAELKASEVPSENVVTEGMWIDMKTHEVGFWGGARAKRDFAKLQQGWPKWTVRWAENGYADQCQISDQPGIAMTDEEALAKFIPRVLSATRFGVEGMVEAIGAMGGELKKKAIKATGCLVFVLAIPILLTGFFMDKIKEAGYAIVALIVIVAIAFKIVEGKLKSKFNKTTEMAEQREEEPDAKPPVAGPLDEQERRRGIQQLLAACGFPSLEELEPHFEKPLSLEDLM